MEINKCLRIVTCGLWAVVVGFNGHGCSRQVPVEEVDVAQSSVVLDESVDPLEGIPWPMWRGPSGDGIATTAEPPTEWSDSQNVRWRVPVPGRGHSSPIVTDTLVLLATAEKQQQQQSVIAFSRADGTQAWKAVVHEGGFPPEKDIHKKATNANSTVATDGQRIFAAFFNSGKIFATALDLSGEQLWQTELGAFNSTFGFAPSPILYKSFVIVAADNKGGGHISAMDAESGEIAWRIARPAESTYSSPHLASFNGKDQLLISGCDRIASYDPATGDELWTTPCLAEATCGTVVTLNDRLFASGGFPERETVCLSSTGDKLWTNRVKLYEPSLIAVGNELYGITDDGIAYCWSAESGDELWKKRLGGSVSASPVFAAGNIYAPNLNGETFVFRATGEQYQQVAVNQLGSDCYASPAIAGRELFLRVGVGTGNGRTEELVCLRREDSPSPQAAE